MSTYDTLLVPEDLSDEAIVELARTMGVAAVCRGVPPRLADFISAADLPTVYTETIEESTDTNGARVATCEVSFDDTAITTKLVEVVATLAAAVEVEAVTDPELSSDETQPEPTPE